MPDVAWLIVPPQPMLRPLKVAVYPLGPEQFIILLVPAQPVPGPSGGGPPPYAPGFFSAPDYGISTSGFVGFIPGNFLHVYNDYGTNPTPAIEFKFLPGGEFLTRTIGLVPYGIGTA